MSLQPIPPKILKVKSGHSICLCNLQEVGYSSYVHWDRLVQVNTHVAAGVCSVVDSVQHYMFCTCCVVYRV